MRHIQAQLPHEKLIYLADQANVPYGSRSLKEIRTYSEKISHFLITQNAKMIVIACNTASSVALTYLRETFPFLPFVGMEPAVKPAAAQTKSGKVGVLATIGTLKSTRYVNLMARFAQHVSVLEDPCLGLVDQIEEGEIDSPETIRLLKRCLDPMLKSGVDTFVLGCTHYPFVLPLIERIIGPEATVIDPAPAVARQAGRVLNQKGLLDPSGTSGDVQAFTSGDPQKLTLLASILLGYPIPVNPVVWRESSLVRV